MNGSSSIKIVSSLPHGGIGKERTDSIINAFKMALSEHNYRVVGTSISYVDMDDAVSIGNAAASSEAANANMAVNDPA